MGWSYFGIPGKRFHVDGKGDLMMGTLSVNGAGVCFFEYVYECVCHLMEKSADGLSTLLSLWRYCVAPSFLCWPLGWGEAGISTWSFRV